MSGNDLRQIESALPHIPPNCGRDVWLKVQMAVKSALGDAGFSVVDEWSKGAANYSARDTRDVWKSIKPGGIGPGTLFHIARQYGWKPDGRYTPPTREELEARRRRQEAEAERERRRTARRHSQVAELAATRLHPAEIVEGNSHPYLHKKGVNSHGLRRVRLWERRTQDENGQWQTIYIKGVLLVPMIDTDGKIWNLQAIFPKPHPALGRDKDYLPGGRTAGLFYRIPPLTGGHDRSEAGTVLIAEGYATAAALFEATGYPVYVAFSAGNLEAVARTVRTQYPTARLVVCADNDIKTPGNPGLAAAHRAARAVNGVVAVPPIGGDFCDWSLAIRTETEHE